MKKCNTISLNEAAVQDAIRKYFLVALECVEAEMIDMFKKEILSNGAGRKKWREEAASYIKETSRAITDDYLELKVGLDESIMAHSEDLFVRVMVAIDGNQADGALHSKPGAQVYGKEIDGKHLSTAKSVFPLPDGFNQTGQADNVAENVIKQIAAQFKAALDAAAESLPDSIFYGNVVVSG